AADLIEWRVDPIVGDPAAVAVIGRLVAESPRPCIVTARAAAEGGDLDADEPTRLDTLLALAGLDPAPRYLDIELATWRDPAAADLRRAMAAAADRPDGPSLILSTHDFTSRPADLLGRVAAMAAEPVCRIMKIVWAARSLRDNLEAFDLLADSVGPTVALCMGPFGLPSRVLAPKFGGLFTFGAPTADRASAPGQPTVDDLRRRYRFDAVTRSTRVYGVIGWPIDHSRSPDVHNVAFEAVGHDGVLLPLPIPPEYEHFKATVGAMLDHARLDFRGAAVTLPHKAHLVRFVRERDGRVSDLAARIDAANTLVVEDDGTLACDNTDAPAAAAVLGRVAGRRVAVLGAGGVASAVVGGLVSAGAVVTVFNRTRDRAAALAARFDGVEIGAAFDAASFDIIVNATSIGMTGGPAPDDSPLDVLFGAAGALRSGVTVFETIYTPRETPLVRAAAQAGARTITGETMFLHQAALQSRRWTGVDAPLAAMEAALIAVDESSSSA
ncbi:MAG: type I 3-dehydroquinate dehydratase, partial [Phycisphaerales bacterium]|nr:type I 3-dehydroquinate dehydratase [Phycisphaerales bacterium]